MLLPTNSFCFLLLAMEFDAIIPAGKGSFQLTNHTFCQCAPKYYFTKTVIFTQRIIILRFSSNSWVTVHIPLYYTVYWTVKWIWKQYYFFCAIYRRKDTFTKNKTIWKILIFQQLSIVIHCCCRFILIVSLTQERSCLFLVVWFLQIPSVMFVLQNQRWGC